MTGPVSAHPNTPLPSFEHADCHPIAAATRREWLETNHRGDYASSTIAMGATRRYHGLLVATPPGLEKRHLFLARFAESLHREERSFHLDTARHAGAWAPPGYSSLDRFSLAPYPTFRYRMGRTTVTREVLLVPDRSIVLSRYTIESPRDDVELRLRPLLAFREADALTFENLHLEPRVQRQDDGGVHVRPYASLPAMTFSVDGAEATFEADPIWHRGVEYPQDLERGYGGHEDHFSPGWFSVALRPGQPVTIAASLDGTCEAPGALFDRESTARRRAASQVDRGVKGALDLAADAYLYATPPGRAGVVAGYPWFGEWGRDTAISLPGLLLARGRIEACGDALEGLLPFLRDGLLPNIFGATPEDSVYGAADASLFFVRAVHLWDRAGGDPERVRAHFRPALEGMADALLTGATPGMRVDDGGLLVAGDERTNATWMDARVADMPVTPRHGGPVEIQALWYQLLAYLEELAVAEKDPAAERRWRRHRRVARRTFLERYWLADVGYLADNWRDGDVDRRVRPNMVIAAALESSPLTRAQRTDVVRLAQAALVTPRGLRTLSPEDAAYEGIYAGGTETRDRAYHQGTVWPWLLGFWVEAYLRSFGASKRRLTRLRARLDAFAPHLREAGLGQISEVFDGDPPHRPGGTIAQAWSVAELLRAFRMVEEGQP